ncbi:TPA: hypothetical protein UL242_002383 [Clostridioides difficile]|uniref:Flp pilus assembly protein RcpC/CpaB domain-containing protein n=1 Tax=Clostridioides difficile TaxID=1496 RepID=A0AAN5VP23_CLODI|nr:hypothetical protein [Clostridioides difficile]CCL32477.1 conserved exported hypothetical protein [Clostridioides difficile E15]EGT3944336.1 hypothetical protein [Clostridioides difficile]MBG0197374.1 hypothetical protein [Clostridioides difficile]MBH7166061.1 hypothetical protein [Clostridioides difficile]
MKNIKNKANILLQFSLFILFAGGVFLFTQSQVKPVAVYQYSRNIPENTVIQKGDYIKTFKPKDILTKSMITNEKDINGKILTTNVYRSEYAIKNNLEDPAKLDEFAKIDLSNLRKVSIPVEMKDAVGGNLKKGDRVDLTFVKQGDSKNNDTSDSFTYAKTFMQDVLVYNVVDDGGKKYVDQTEGTQSLANEKGEVVESGSLSIVTVAVTAQQAEEIYARHKDGDIGIIGRFKESQDTGTSGYTIGEYKNIKTQESSPEN